MRSRVWIGVAVVLVGVMVGAVVAQERGRGMGRRWQDMSPEQRAQMWERMQERQLTRLQEQLDASEEEWAVLVEPTKALLALTRDEREAGQELRQAVAAEGTTTEQLTQALATYRKALKDIAARREKLQAELKKLVTLRQEAVLVLERILD